MSNMVSKIINKGLLLFASLLAFASCDRPFTLELPLAVDSNEYILSSKEGEARIFFYTTMPWNIVLEPDECSWGTLSRTSGTGSEAVEEILFTYQENLDPDRKVTLVINAGDLQEKITISQTGIAREWWDGSVGVDDLVIKPQP